MQVFPVALCGLFGLAHAGQDVLLDDTPAAVARLPQRSHHAGKVDIAAAQLAENAGVNTDLTLTEEEQSSLSLGAMEEGLYCQGCEQCTVGCRRQLPIPDIMRAYMYAYGYGNKEMAHELLTAARISENPCRNCSACSVRCPKGFVVAEKISDISRLVNIPVEFLS